ncbi:unnamed protein product [Diamesa tonsa]
MIKLIFALSVFCVCATGQRITTIHLDGVQYYVSRMNPYSPELNYYLAYQYCRSLGLQLASFDTKEKYESITKYLTNAKFNNYDYWTSGNRLGTGMFLWMSTGLPFNSTFDFFENEHELNGIDPLDHNGNTSPQRTARDDTQKADTLENHCVVLQQPSLKWAPDDCLKVKDFICEQTRCYYYNYGSIPVSSSQGRPIATTTTPYPMTHTETTALYKSLASTTVAPSVASSSEESEESTDAAATDTVNYDEEEEHTNTASSEDSDYHTESAYPEHQDISEEEIPVEQKLRQITEEIEKYSNKVVDKVDLTEDDRQSFFSLSDLIKTLRPDDKEKAPQIDSDYSNTMRVLGEQQKSDAATVYETPASIDPSNRSLFK